MFGDQQLRSEIRGIANRLTKLATKVRDLTADLAKVNAKTQRAGATIGPLSIGSTDVTITWPQPWPDTFYWVGIELLTGTAAIGNVHATLKAGSKTTTGCVITVTALASVATMAVDVVGIRT